MFGVPGLNNSIQESAFMKSFSISHVISLTLGLVAASLSFSSSVSADGTMECWGAGGTNTGYFPNYGQSMLPTPVPIATNIAAGWTHSMAILSTGNVSAWGSNINNRRAPRRQSRRAGAVVSRACDCVPGRSWIAAGGSSAHVARLGAFWISSASESAHRGA